MSDYPLELDVGFAPDTEKKIEEWRSATRGVVSGQQFDNAIRLAVNRALDAATAKGKQVARRSYTIDKGTLDKATRPRHAGTGSLTAVLEFRGRRVPAVNFEQPQQTPEGVAVKFKKDGGGIIESAFLGKLGKKTDVFIRKFRGKGSAELGTPGTHGRFPIISLTGPAVVSMVGHEKAAAEIQARAREILDKRIDHEMKRVLTK